MLNCQVVAIGVWESMSTLTSRRSSNDVSHELTHGVADLVQLKSQKVAWEILAMLSRVTEAAELRTNSSLTCKRFKGKVSHGNFKLTYSSLLNPFVRTMHGRVIAMDGGCLIQYRMEMSGMARTIFCVWFIAIMALFASKVGAALIHGIAPGGYDDFVMIFLIVMFSLYIAQLMLAEGKRQEAQIEQFLLDMACGRKNKVMV